MFFNDVVDKDLEKICSKELFDLPLLCPEI
jgi:hypothetical protein